MEDPWANAWGEPEKPQIESWTHTQKPETDLAVPSWVTASDVTWTEPSNTQQSPWNAQHPVKEWNPSPYDTFSVGKSSTVEISQPDRSPPPTTPEEIPSPSPLPSPEISVQSLEPASYDEPPIPRSRSLSPRAGSPDGFGTFETGLDVNGAGVDPWGPSTDMPAPASSKDPWVPTWEEGKPKSDVELKGEPVDEWEAAKQRKERQDRHVVRRHFCHSYLLSDDISAAKSIEFDSRSI